MGSYRGLAKPNKKKFAFRLPTPKSEGVCRLLKLNTPNFSPDFVPQPTLRGKHVELRPLRPEHFAALYAVACDPWIWEQHPSRDRYQEEVFKGFFREALESGAAFLVTDRDTGAVIGSTRFNGYDPKAREVEVGWTFLARSHWGGLYNGEMKQLLLEHAFQFVDTVLFVIGQNNLRSRKAIEKLGARISPYREGREACRVVYEISVASWRNRLLENPA